MQILELPQALPLQTATMTQIERATNIEFLSLPPELRQEILFHTSNTDLEFLRVMVHRCDLRNWKSMYDLYSQDIYFRAASLKNINLLTKDVEAVEKQWKKVLADLSAVWLETPAGWDEKAWECRYKLWMKMNWTSYPRYDLSSGSVLLGTSFKPSSLQYTLSTSSTQNLSMPSSESATKPGPILPTSFLSLLRKIHQMILVATYNENILQELFPTQQRY